MRVLLGSRIFSDESTGRMVLVGERVSPRGGLSGLLFLLFIHHHIIIYFNYLKNYYF